mmetsp:Transcript_37382/g.93931  ORF Transcript_37382/g.93931 Transcript_37382/m.93931 type:complete len:313 (-) Transcript_37382:32-970(-)
MAREVLRSRICRRRCPSRAVRAAKPQAWDVKLPDTPLILAGALGGPFCIYVTTPLRNALTLASQDPYSSAWALYAAVFSGGLTSGWMGGLAPVLPSCPQFCVLGPLFHFLNKSLGNVALAVCLSAMAETLISYSSNTINAQMAFNHEQELAGSSFEVPLVNLFVPYGPGAFIHVCRNIVALSGIRIFSMPCLNLLCRFSRAAGLKLPEEFQSVLADFISSLGAGCLSAPLNQCYNFAITSTAYMESGGVERLHKLGYFLSTTYLVHGPGGEIVGLSTTLGRDLFMRCTYTATLFAIFGSIERTFAALWKKSS